MVFRFQLKNKEIDTEAAVDFWRWFSENEEMIADRCRTDGRRLVFEIDQRLVPVFSYYKGELEFCLGFNEGRGEFFFFHKGNRHLKRDGEKLGELMPEDLRRRWKFVIER
jgi:hypothetical protein